MCHKDIMAICAKCRQHTCVCHKTRVRMNYKKSLNIINQLIKYA